MNFGVNIGCSFSVVLFVAIICEGIWWAGACDLDQRGNGCRIDNGACSCSYGCKSEYRYATRKECLDALKGRSNDLCSREPCQHGGTCIQVSQSPGYRCRCDGTGFWGNRCQRKCPDNVEGKEFPYECIII